MYAANLDAVLTAYARPVDPRFPLVCFDESGKELQRDYRPPLPMRSGQPARMDHTFVHTGSSAFLLFLAPHLGWRQIKVTARRTGQDFAEAMRDLVDLHFPQAEQITVVLDNLNTHHKGSLYRAFPPAEALRIATKLTLVHTPKHGSWVNMAELEFSALSRQCLRRRIPDRATLEREIGAWVRDRNARAVTVQWSFTTADAHRAMAHVYPNAHQDI